MSSGVTHWRPSLLPLLAVLILLPTMIALGIWQLDRAEQKRALQAEYDVRAGDAPVSITARLQPVEELRFYRVEAKGHYDTEHQFLLDNRVHKGRVGYYVMTPLRIQGSDVRVLVNRGWIPLGPGRARLPDIPTPAGPQTVYGLATVPLKGGFRLGQAVAQDAGWQPVWQYLDLHRYRDAVPFPIQPVVVLLDPHGEAGGFVREWKRLDTGIAVHQGYAFQWFSLAVALLAIYLFVNVRGRKGGDRAGEQLK